MSWADFLRKVPERDLSLGTILRETNERMEANKCKVCGCYTCPRGQPCCKRPRIGRPIPCAGCGCVRGNSFYQGSPPWAESEQLNMINVQRNNPAADGGAAPRGVQFLSPRHVTKDGTKAKIIKVTTDRPDNFSNPYVVYFTMNGEKYSKGFKSTSANLISLVDLFGGDEKKWLGKEVLISKTIGDEGDERLAFTSAK